MLPVIIAAGTPENLALPADRRGEGRLIVPAVFQIRVPIDGVEDLDRLLDQCLGAEPAMEASSGSIK
jgi:hypothetical protein